MKCSTPPRFMRWLGLALTGLLAPGPSVVQAQSSPAGGPRPGPLTATASQTVCQGGSAVLTADGGFDPGTSVTYTWTPNADLTATSGQEVVVAPLHTTTYTVTSYSPQSDIVTRTRSVTVTVETNCCQQSYAPKVVELDYSYYGYGVPPVAAPAGAATGGTPFTGPPGTYYHASGDLVLYNDDFVLPAGSVLLMESGARVILDDAILDLDGSSITAACDQMWGGVLLQHHNHGFNTRARGTLRSRLLHALTAVDVEDYAGPPSTNGPTGSLFGLNDTDFLHNYYGLALHRQYTPSRPTDYVKGCRFDSDPHEMKSPYKYQDPYTQYYSQAHVYLAGDASPVLFSQNDLQHAVFGLYSDTPNPSLTLDQCTLGDFYLVGAFSGDQALPAAAPGPGLRFTTCTFTFPKD